MNNNDNKTYETKTRMEMQLASSAFNLLHTSLGLYESNPQVAILLLATSVELFLKYRLMIEHWTLILKNPDSASLTDLESGKLFTINIDSAVNRVNSILPRDQHIKETIPGTISQLTKERNKVAHFYNNSLSGTEQADKAAELQVRVWHELNHLFVSKWKNHFDKYRDDIYGIWQKLAVQREHLKHIFDAKKEYIEKCILEGNQVLDCPACKYEAVIVGREFILEDGLCCVCSLNESFLVLNCPGCHREIAIEGLGNECPHADCRLQIGEEELLDESLISYVEDEIGTTVDCWCESCGADGVYLSKGIPICLSCYTRLDGIHRCENCGEFYAGEYIDLTSEVGCPAYGCDGRASRMKDD